MKSVEEIKQALEFSKEAAEDCSIQWQFAVMTATVGILEWVLELKTRRAEKFQQDIAERNPESHSE